MKILISKTAKKSLDGYPKPIRENIAEAIYCLPKGDVKKMSGKANFHRLRVGKYRVLYEIEGDLIKVAKIDSRGDIYK